MDQKKQALVELTMNHPKFDQIYIVHMFYSRLRHFHSFPFKLVLLRELDKIKRV